jgi:molybdate transport system ATP-binding protein
VTLYVKVKKNFGAFLLDVEFEAQSGVTALLGASGCGKSMTLKCIAGAVRPDEGRIVSDGAVLFDSEKKINLPPQRRGVGLLFQNYALFPNMTVEQNIACVLLAADKRGKKTSSRNDLPSLFRKYHLDGLEKHYPGNLSGGQQQRVALARILASSPSVIMLDEPFSALDSYLRWQLEGELADMLEEFGGAALYVSHNRDEVYRLCERICVMNAGRIEPVRAKEELFEAPDTLSASLLSGCKNYSRTEKISENRVRALDWNTELECGKIVTDDVRYAGVRAHYVYLSDGDGSGNIFPCRVTRIVQDVFHTIVNVVPSGASEERGFSHIRMEISRELAAGLCAGDLISVMIKPEDVLLLKQ